MTHYDHATGEAILQSARRERNELFAEFGQKVIRVPVKLVRSGLDDLRRYRRPIKTI